MTVPYIHTKEGITVVLGGQPYHAAKDEAIYDQVVEGVTHLNEEGLIDIFQKVAKQLKSKIALTYGFEYSGGVVKYLDEVLHNYAVDRLVELIEADKDYQPLVNFLERLMSNPSRNVVSRLYEFLEKGRMPITEDGYFLAYKKVRADYKDIHSAKFDNKIGAYLSMPRNQVDEDMNRTCSIGFHVCSYDYLPHFGRTDGDHVMVVKVNPVDVVAIPTDYNDTKMRVAAYEVTDEVTNYFKDGVKVLSQESVHAASGKRDYIVLYRNYFDDEDEEHGRFWTEGEAIAEAKELYDDDSSSDLVWVERLSDEKVVWDSVAQ